MSVYYPQTSYICVPHHISRYIRQLQCHFILSSVPFQDLLTLPRTSQHDHPGNSHNLPLVSDAQFPFLGYGVMSANRTVHELPGREICWDRARFHVPLLPTNLIDSLDIWRATAWTYCLAVSIGIAILSLNTMSKKKTPKSKGVGHWEKNFLE